MNADKDSRPQASRLGRALVALGIGGAALAALCCFAPFILGGLITAIGLGFILKDSILMGLLVVFVGVAMVGLYLAQRKHT
jgi:hypothetical protein